MGHIAEDLRRSTVGVEHPDGHSGGSGVNIVIALEGRTAGMFVATVALGERAVKEE